MAAMFLGIVALLLLSWLVIASSLPEWLKLVIVTVLTSGFVGGGTVARRRYRGRSPWSMKKTERP